MDYIPAWECHVGAGRHGRVALCINLVDAAVAGIGLTPATHRRPSPSDTRLRPLQQERLREILALFASRALEPDGALAAAIACHPSPGRTPPYVL